MAVFVSHCRTRGEYLGRGGIACIPRIPPPAAHLLGELDAVHDLEERLRARLDDVRADARPAVGSLVVLDVHDRLALRVLAAGHAAQLEFAEQHRDAGGRLDGLERRIDRSIAAGAALDEAAIGMTKPYERLPDTTRHSGVACCPGAARSPGAAWPA